MSDITEQSGAKPTEGANAQNGHPAVSTFALQIISPSIGVSAPLRFSELPIATTVKELKAKIRDALPTKPIDEHQRLIHRGRMLGNGAETMAIIFGTAAVCHMFSLRCTY